MEKGFVFSIDALYGIAIAVMIFSAATLLLAQDNSSGAEKLSLYTKAADETLSAFYLNEANENPGASEQRINCKEIEKYSGSGAIGTGQNAEALQCSSA